MKKLIFIILLLPSLALAQTKVVDPNIPVGLGQTAFSNTTASDITDTTTTQIKAAGSTFNTPFPGAKGVQYYVKSFSVSNLHATTAVRCDLLDGASTVLWQCPAGAAGGGCVISFPTALVGTMSTALNCKCSGSGTVRCSVAGVAVQF